MALDMDKSVVNARGGWRGLGGGTQRGKMGDICDSVNNKKHHRRDEYISISLGLTKATGMKFFIIWKPFSQNADTQEDQTSAIYWALASQVRKLLSKVMTSHVLFNSNINSFISK